MKKMFAVVVCCALLVASVKAQDISSVVEAPNATVVAASAQEPVADNQSSANDVVLQNQAVPQTFVQDAAAAPAMVQEASPVVVEGQNMAAAPAYGNNGCGCGSVVTNYAAPMATGYTDSGCGCGSANYGYGASNYGCGSCTYGRGCGSYYGNNWSGYGNSGCCSDNSGSRRGFRGLFGRNNTNNNGCCY